MILFRIAEVREKQHVMHHYEEEGVIDKTQVYLCTLKDRNTVGGCSKLDSENAFATCKTTKSNTTDLYKSGNADLVQQVQRMS